MYGVNRSKYSLFPSEKQTRTKKKKINKFVSDLVQWCLKWKQDQDFIIFNKKIDIPGKKKQIQLAEIFFLWIMIKSLKVFSPLHCQVKLPMGFKSIFIYFVIKKYIWTL